VLVALAALIVCVGAAAAARPATAAEKRAILEVAGFDPNGAGFKSGCIAPTVRVSGSYAFASFTFRQRPACVRYPLNGSNGFRLTAGKWKQIFIGSEVPPCSLGLPADLTPCLPAMTSPRVTALGYERAVLTGDMATACAFLSARGVAALRSHLGQPASADCLTVMRVWAGERDHGLPDDIANCTFSASRSTARMQCSSSVG